MLKLVPFHTGWINHDRLDLKAIYRRPRFVEDTYGELVREVGPDGLPLWDLTGPLPVKSHNKYLAKGFEYVTLADRDSLVSAAKAGSIEHWQQYAQDPRTGGPWQVRKYLEGQAEAVDAAAAKLRELVHRYGSEMVEAMRQETTPGYRLPEALRGIPPASEADADDAPARKGRRKAESEAHA